jgi:hypothetical protein
MYLFTSAIIEREGHRRINIFTSPSFQNRCTSKNGFFWDVTPCGSSRNRSSKELSASFIRATRIGELGTTLGTDARWYWYCYHLVFLRSFRRLLVTASVLLSSPILVTLMKEALRSSQTSVFIRATRRNIPEDAILHSHRRENLQSYIGVPHWRTPSH